MRTKNIIKKPYIKLRKLFRKKKPTGALPGSLIYTGEKTTGEPVINLIKYDTTSCDQIKITEPENLRDVLDKNKINWIDIEGLNNVNLIGEIGKQLELHPLVTEDILNVEQRAKTEDYENYTYIVLRMFHLKGENKEIIPEQLSIILGKNFIATFQEGIEGDSFQKIRARLRENYSVEGKITLDYLLYLLIDSVIDSYFDVLEILGERTESIEEELVNNPDKNTLTSIYTLKREMLFLRKTIWPLREAIVHLERNTKGLISAHTLPYYRDLYDHTINVLDTMETYREMLTSMIDIYLSSFSNKLNETMKYLALISTIFIPMTFIASIYGMNFQYMPELEWLLGYPFALGLMFLVGITFLIIFKKKKWV
ncbi:MAG: magnesium/cobalt transporter CorA [Ignavibacteria bacterium]|nr:magnesium/cobalt transporter CorA [Ignavibacteria bacterium]